MCPVQLGQFRSFGGCTWSAALQCQLKDDAHPSDPSLTLPSLSSLLLARSSSCKAANLDGAIPDFAPEEVLTVFVLQPSSASPVIPATKPHLSCRRAYSSIFTLRSKSTLRFSADRRCPSRRAIRACLYQSIASAQPLRPTHSHLGSLDLPLVTVSLPTPPLALKVMQHIGEVHLWRRGGRRRCGIALRICRLPSLLRSSSGASILPLALTLYLHAQQRAHAALLLLLRGAVPLRRRILQRPALIVKRKHVGLLVSAVHPLMYSRHLSPTGLTNCIGRIALRVRRDHRLPVWALRMCRPLYGRKRSENDAADDQHEFKTEARCRRQHTAAAVR